MDCIRLECAKMRSMFIRGLMLLEEPGEVGGKVFGRIVNDHIIKNNSS